MVAKERKITRVEKVGRAGGVDKRNRAGGRAMWSRESEGEGMLPLLPAGEADQIR